MEFEVSFRETLRQLADAQARLNSMGKVLDTNAKKAGDMESATSRAANQVRIQFDNLNRYLQRNNMLTQELSAHLASAQRNAERVFLSIASGNARATSRLQAFNGEMGNLERLVRDTASKQAYTRWLERSAAMVADSAGKTEFYRQKLNELATQEGRSAVQAAALANQRSKEIRQTALAASHASALSEAHVTAYRRQQEAQRAAQQQSSNYTAIINQMTAAEREKIVTGQQVAWGYERITATLAALTAQQRAAKSAIDQANRSMIEGAANLERYTGAGASAERAASRLADEERRAALARRRQMDELRKDIEERARLREREESLYARQANADRITQHDRERARVLSQLRAAIEERYASESKSRQLLERLTREEAAYQQRLERVNASIRMRNDLRRAEAAASNTLSDSEARLTQRIREQTAEYQRRARYMQMTNAQLLGLTRSHDRISRDLHLNAQAAAMFRAALGGLNASIGIYTSATVLAASATYAIASAFRTGMSAGMEFTETMARAEAVMMTSSRAATAAGKSMQAVTMQVRALGASTLFTSTEVAGGLVDLGMAGLSASEAMTALAPSLNLAAIGSIEMSRAADIATNVMTSFDKTASQLGHVVDVMATAITNSNTNIEQLANALSYVGPAAQAAGFDLKDTTASIELLSNAGIKASRAGTGLRRFMLNIQNPTAKGAEVMDRFNISIVDAEGQTRSMMDILGQFNRALHNDAITPAERTAAIMDLVGVRAQSAVARMISSFEQFGALRRQLDEVDGAAARMRETMEDVLSMDWRQLKSAFQDIQLDAFLKYEETLRSFTAQARLSLMELQAVNEEMTNLVFSPEDIASGKVVTELDILISKVGEAADVAMGLGIAFATWKAANVAGTMMAALSTKTANAASVFSVLNARGNVLSATNINLAATVRNLTAATQAHWANVVHATTWNERMTAGLYSLSTAATYAARALGYVSAALGWAGVVYGVYTAVTTLFSNDTADRIRSHEDRVEAARSRYQQLQDQIEKTTEARQRLALVTRREEAERESQGLQLRIDRLQTSLEVEMTESSRRQVLDDIILLEQRLKSVNQQAEDTGEALQQLGVNQLQFESLRRSTTDMAVLMGDFRQAIDTTTYSSGNAGASLAEMAMAAQQGARSVDRYAKGMAILSSAMALFSARTDEAREAHMPFVDMLREQLQAQRDLYQEEQRFSNLTDYQKMNELVERRTELEGELARRVAEGVDIGSDAYQRTADSIMEVEAEILKLGTSVANQYDNVAEAQARLEKLQLNEVDTLETLRQKLNEVAVARAAMYATGESVDPEAALELLNRQIELQERYNRLSDRESRGTSRSDNSAQRELESALQVFERLQAQYAPLVAAQREFNDTQKQLESLLQGGHIAAEDYNDALAHLRKRLYEATVENNRLQSSLQELSSRRFTSPFTAMVDDLAKMNQLLEAGMLSQSRYHLLHKQMVEDLRMDDLPSVNITGLENTSSMPFGDFIGAVSSQSEGLKEYLKRSESLNLSRELDRERITGEAERLQAELEAQQLSQQAHAAEMLRIKQDEHAKLLAAEAIYQQQSSEIQARQREYTEQSAMATRAALVGGLSDVFGMIASAGEDATNAQKVAFAAQKALSVAQIIMYTELAAIRAGAEAGIAGIPLSTLIRTQGYAAAGLVGALSVGQLTGAATGTSAGSSYAGMFDSGGYIHKGQFGLVAEKRPEFVNGQLISGPAKVTGGAETAKRLAKGGDFNFSPQINIEINVTGEQAGDPAQMASVIAKQVENQVYGIFRKEMRPNGALDRWKRQ